MTKSERRRAVPSSVAALGFIVCASCQAAQGGDTANDCRGGKDCAVQETCRGRDCKETPGTPTEAGVSEPDDTPSDKDDVADVPTLHVITGTDAATDEGSPEGDAGSTERDAGLPSSPLPPDAGAADANDPDASAPMTPTPGSLDAGATEVDVGLVDAGPPASAVDSGVDVSDASLPEPDEPVVPPPPCNTGTFSAPEPLETLEVAGDYWSPAWSPDGLVIYFSVSGPGLSNPNFGEAIYRAARPDRQSPFGPAEPVAELNTAVEQGSPHLSADGQTIVFSVLTSTALDLYGATLDPSTETWSGVTKLPTVNANADDDLPWLSTDAATLYFTSSRFAGKGATDLWVSTRTQDGFTTPTALTQLNTSAPEQSPSLSPDELTLYFTSRRGNYGARFRVYAGTRGSTTENFANAAGVTELNESGNTVHVALSRDGREILLASDREGGQRLWLARRECPTEAPPEGTP